MGRVLVYIAMWMRMACSLKRHLYVGTFQSFGEFELFSAVDPALDLITETDDAFGFDNHFGIRTMAVFDGKLMIGSATARNGEACKVFEASARRLRDADDVVGGDSSFSIGRFMRESFDHTGKTKDLPVSPGEWVLMAFMIGIVALNIGLIIGFCMRNDRCILAKKKAPKADLYE